MQFIGQWTKKHFDLLRLRWAGGDYTEDQERIQREFNDDGLIVRWNLRDHKTEVWYTKGGPPYCVVSYDGRMDIAKACKDLRGRLKNNVQLRGVYDDHMTKMERDFNFKRDDCYAELGRGVKNISRNRVITSG